MSNTIKPFLLRKEYERWLKEKDQKLTTKKSRSCYIMLKHFNNDKKKPLYYDIIASFLYYDDLVYAYTVLDDWGNILKGKYKSYWRKYRDFIHCIDKDNVCFNTSLLVDKSILDGIKGSFNKPDLYKIEGMDSLIAALHGEDNFIKLAIESSYFFDKRISQQRHCEICDFIEKGDTRGIHKNDGTALPARSSETDEESKQKNEGSQVERNGVLYYIDENGNTICQIKTDGNGNTRVCGLINQYFGYHLGKKGYEKPFKDFIISHIWGRAIDPRYFTNLWNIVLVPAWANHLLDKNPPKGSLASRFKNTMMKICINYNGLNNSKLYHWPDKMKMPKVKVNKDILKLNEGRKYRIQIIEKLDENQKASAYVGSIERVPVPV